VILLCSWAKTNTPYLKKIVLVDIAISIMYFVPWKFEVCGRKQSAVEMGKKPGEPLISN